MQEFKKVIDERLKKRDEIIEKIRIRDQEFKETRKLLESRVSMTECMDYLSNLGVKTVKFQGKNLKFEKLKKPNSIIRFRP